MEYEKYLRSRNLSDNTVCIYTAQARQFELYLKGRNVNTIIVNDYINMIALGHCPGTVNTYIIALNQYLDWKGIRQCRGKTRRIQKKQSLDNVLSREEYTRLLAYARESGREKYYLIMRTLVGTGMRISELLSVTVEMLASHRVIVFNKGKYREIFVAESLNKELLAYCEQSGIHSGIVFKGRNSRALDRHSVWEMLKKIGDMTGVEQNKVYPHSFRHLFAKAYMEKYGNLTELAALLGHSSLETTRIYTLTSSEEKRREIEQLGL